MAYEQFIQNAGGYTDQQLRVDFPALVGIEGEDLKKFQELYDGRAFADFVQETDDAFQRAQIKGTPTFIVNGKQLEFVNESTKEVLIQPTADDLLKAIEEANA